ncbi:MAG: M20 family metallopeptidase [Phycisphaerales bacterium]|nr:M20 family metallopeptidase [Phycisphaerales bacterium]
MTVLSDLDLLARLVSFDTTSATKRPTRPLGDFVCDYLDHSKIRIERFDCGGEQENLWFETGPPSDGDGEGLLLCGHVDVVPATEPEWTADPFILRVEGDRAIGRGACDMKGFDAIAINLLREAANAGSLEAPLGLLLTCNEEIGTVGAGQFAAQWAGRPLPRRTIVGEPTSLQPVRGHKGHLGIAIVVGGLGGHTGFPNRGVNAIERAMPVLEGLRDLRQSMVEERLDASDLFPETPFPVLTVAGIEGGSAINVMPESCVIRVGVRLLPGQSAEEFLPRLRSAIEGRGIGVDMRSGDLESPLPMAARDECLVIDLNNTPSYAIDSDAAFLAEVADLVGDHGSHGANFGTDAGRLVGLGCESVVFGPGNIGVAHKPDEWMPLDEFARTPELLRRLIR